MRSTLHNFTLHCIEDAMSFRTRRVKWIGSWPSQVSIAVNQLFWTREVELALKQAQLAGATPSPRALQSLLVKLNVQV